MKIAVLRELAEGETRVCLKCGNKTVVAEPEEVALA